MVVEDDKNTRKFFQTVLLHAGYNVYTAENGEDALDILDLHQIDLIILDIMMPKMDGYIFAKDLRFTGIQTPILMATAKHLQEDINKGFIVGTDDYMTKPIDADELLLRIKALLRRFQIVNERKLCIGDVLLDYDSLTVTKGDVKQTLPQKEFYLLYKLLSYPERIFTRIELMDEIWGMETESSDTTVNVHINRLRNRFADFTEFNIVSVRGLGYKAVKNI